MSSVFNRRGFIGSLIAGVAAVLYRLLPGSLKKAIPKQTWKLVSDKEYLDWILDELEVASKLKAALLISYTPAGLATLIDKIAITIGGERVDTDETLRECSSVFIDGYSIDKSVNICSLKLNNQNRQRHVCELATNGTAGRWTRDGVTITCRRVVKGIPT